MEKKKGKTVKELERELADLQQIIDSIPAVLYINELKRSGDISSGNNVWLNRRGHDFINCTAEEIDLMGFDFFKVMVHPDDLERMSVGSKVDSKLVPEGEAVSMLRIRSKIDGEYHWFYCSKTVMETFADGTTRKVLTLANEIKEIIFGDHQFVNALNELHRHSNSLKIFHITHSESTVLGMIIRGMTDAEIAKDLSRSIATIKKHRTNLIHKVGVKNSISLVALAVASGEY